MEVRGEKMCEGWRETQGSTPGDEDRDREDENMMDSEGLEDGLCKDK